MRSIAVSNNNYMPLLRQMLVTQHEYILTKMRDKRFKLAYLANIEPLILEAHIGEDLIDFEMYFDILKNGTLSIKVPFYKRMFCSSKREGTEYAFELVQDILTSIDLRFISGGFRLYEDLLLKKVR